MMSVIACIAQQHDYRLVLLAAVVCSTGAWCVIRLFARATQTTRLQRYGWLVLSTIAGGATIWCTHFIAMLGYKADYPVSLDPLVTAGSLLIAMVGTGAGLWIASLRPHWAPAVGGGVTGLAISAMHYTGMIAYRVQGIVSWDKVYLGLSIAAAVAFSATALHTVRRRRVSWSRGWASVLFVVGIVSLHFIGMTAFRVQPLLIDAGAVNTQALTTLAVAVAGVGLVIVLAGAASYIIDGQSRAETFEKIRHMALHDALTGLPNRTSFRERFQQEAESVDCEGGELALLCIDLDRFKEVNDTRGHAAGDRVLSILSQRMSDLLGEGEFIGRLGGDEFAAGHRVKSESSLQDFIVRLEFALTKPIELDDYHFIPGASIGVALYPRDASDVTTLANNADLALYRAKASKTGDTTFYEPSMDEAVRDRRTLAGELREALAHERLEVHYQVQTNVSTGSITGYEALVRWKHPVRGYVSPSEFIPLAEDEGLILQVGEWVLRRACADAMTWDQPYMLAVNCSPLQLAHGNLAAVVMSILIETGLPPKRLELELTETAIFADKERALHVLRQIKALGVSIALDDFGTGYSSLETLRSFPFDKIKLDATFMREVDKNPQAIAIVRAVLALGRSLDIPVLAEGIETEAQLAVLRSEGCDEAQGFLMGRPAALSAILASAEALLNQAAGDDQQVA